MDPTREEILAGYNRRPKPQFLAAGRTRKLAPPPEQRHPVANEELLFHMVFGYMVVRALIPLVHVVSRLPEPVGRRFAALLNAGTRPFVAAISRRLKAESDDCLSRSMPFPDRWTPSSPRRCR